MPETDTIIPTGFFLPFEDAVLPSPRRRGSSFISLRRQVISFPSTTGYFLPLEEGILPSFADGSRGSIRKAQARAPAAARELAGPSSTHPPLIVITDI